MIEEECPEPEGPRIFDGPGARAPSHPRESGDSVGAPREALKPASGGPALPRHASTDALLVAPPLPWLRPPVPRICIGPPVPDTWTLHEGVPAQRQARHADARSSDRGQLRRRDPGPVPAADRPVSPDPGYRRSREPRV